jgi:hypothetical protein
MQYVNFIYVSFLQEKQRLIAAFGVYANKQHDLDECAKLIDIHMAFVRGDEPADPDVGLYPLPLNAYGKATAPVVPEHAEAAKPGSCASSASPEECSCMEDNEKKVNEMFESSSKQAQESKEHSVRENTARDILNSISHTGVMPSRQTIQDMQKKNQMAADALDDAHL